MTDRSTSKSSNFSDSESEEEEKTDEEQLALDAKRHKAATRLQAQYRGRVGRLKAAEVRRKLKQKEIESFLETAEFEGKSEVMKIKRVTWEGDPLWINRL
eukprot:SAG11_NODE_3780_length_2231_cov_1.947467_5_plen_100_part_00